MSDQTMTPQATPEPELKKKSFDPKGVMQRNSKAVIFVGVAALVVLATLFSAKGKPASAHSDKTSSAPQPLVQDTTETNVADLKSHVADQQRALDQSTISTDPALTNATPAQRAAAMAYGPNGQATPCIPGQPCVQATSYGYPQPGGGGGASNLTPEEQAWQQLAAKERERSYESRFPSNLAYSRPPDAPQSSQVQAATPPQGSDPVNPYAMAANQTGGSLIAPRAAGQPASASADTFGTSPQPKASARIRIVN
jgi:type IV secretion system protein TrbI